MSTTVLIWGGDCGGFVTEVSAVLGARAWDTSCVLSAIVDGTHGDASDVRISGPDISVRLGRSCHILLVP